MHIEPGIVDAAKIALSYATAGAALSATAVATWRAARTDGVLPVAGRAAVASALVFVFFEILPHYPVGVSEVHLILGATLFLLFGAAPAAIGLATGLLVQGLFFAPFDLPQYGMNVTTLLVPLFAVRWLAGRVVPDDTAYVDLSYGQVLSLSAAYQGGVVAWVAFWAIYGQGFAAANLAAIATFGAAYALVIVLEPLIDLLVLGAAKGLRSAGRSGLFTARLFRAA